MGGLLLFSSEGTTVELGEFVVVVGMLGPLVDVMDSVRTVVLSAPSLTTGDMVKLCSTAFPSRT